MLCAQPDAKRRRRWEEVPLKGTEKKRDLLAEYKNTEEWLDDPSDLRTDYSQEN